MFEATAKVLEVQFNTQNLAQVAPAAPFAVKWPNTPFKQPTNGEWVVPTIVPGSGRQDSMGSPKLERQLGIVTVQIFVPKNSGDRRARAIADTVASWFRYQTFKDDTTGTNVILRAPEATKVGERADSYQLNLRIPFQAERLFS